MSCGQLFVISCTKELTIDKSDHLDEELSVDKLNSLPSIPVQLKEPSVTEMADDDNLDLLLSMFDESPEEQATSGGGEDNFDDLFDNENDDEGEGYVEPEEEKVEEAEEPEEEEESHNRSKEDLEAELRRMQEKMQALQEQLQASQGGGSGSAIKSPPPKPKNTSSASTPKPKGASTSTSTNRTAVTSSPAPKATKTPHTAAATKPSPTTAATKPSPTTAATKPSPTAAAAKLSPTTAATKLSPTAAVAKSSPLLPAAKASPPTAAASTKKPRAAHQPKAGGSSQIQSPPSTSGIASFSQAIGSLSKVNSTLKSPPPSGSTKPPARQGTPRPTSTTQDVPVEKFSGLRIRKPRISSIDIEQKMSGRKLIQLSQLPDKIARDNLEDSDWVTFAVLVNKMTPQSKNNGKTFSIWKLNDLQNLEVYISFFLFGNVHTELWKTDTGTVIGILNPNQLKNKEGSNSNEVTLTIDHPQKVLILGEALDFGTCKAMKKNGDPCTQLVNMYKCQYCQYHVQAQYKKLSSKRAELQSSFTGTTPKGRGRGKGSLREKLCQSDFHYAGMSSLACAPNANGPQPKKPTQSTLNNIVLRGPRLALQSDEVSGCSDDFKGLLSQPTPGALNIKRHLGQVKAAVPGASSVQSISALDLLKQQKAMHKERMLNRQKRAQEIQQRVLQSSGKGTPPARPLSNGTGVLSPKPLPPPSPRLSDPTTPTLGRGLSEGDDILFELSPPPPSSSLSAGKMAALRKLHSKGAAITKDDPNAVKRKRVSSSDIAARVEKNRSSPEGGENSAAGEEEEPAQKKRRAQLEYVQSEEFQRILNAKSKFSWLMGEMEVQVMQEYFEPLVQKEQMEEKMRSIREQKCRAVTCKSCKYTHFKPADRCVQENHDYHWHDAHKRFFKCPCGQRKISLARIPNMACSNCGQFKWERDGMLKEKKGPKIGGELLMPRGDEQPKFLNSMK